MRTIERLIANCENVQSEVSVLMADKMRENGSNLIEQVKWEQLWNGVDGDGNSLKPSYSNDSYFESRQKATDYMRWKEKITGNPKRKSDDPNLYINGKFYSTLEVEFRKDEFEVLSRDAMGRDIIRKYGKPAFGVSLQFLSDLIKSKYYQQVRSRILSVILSNK